MTGSKSHTIRIVDVSGVHDRSLGDWKTHSGESVSAVTPSRVWRRPFRSVHLGTMVSTSLRASSRLVVVSSVRFANVR